MANYIFQTYLVAISHKSEIYLFGCRTESTFIYHTGISLKQLLQQIKSRTTFEWCYRVGEILGGVLRLDSLEHVEISQPGTKRTLRSYQ